MHAICGHAVIHICIWTGLIWHAYKENLEFYRSLDDGHCCFVSLQLPVAAC